MSGPRIQVHVLESRGRRTCAGDAKEKERRGLELYKERNQRERRTSCSPHTRTKLLLTLHCLSFSSSSSLHRQRQVVAIRAAVASGEALYDAVFALVPLYSRIGNGDADSMRLCVGGGGGKQNVLGDRGLGHCSPHFAPITVLLFTTPIQFPINYVDSGFLLLVVLLKTVY